MRADKSAVSRVKLPRIATISSNRFFNAASDYRRDDNPGKQEGEK
jgi:hypothetical protein